VLLDRTNLEVDPRPGTAQTAVLKIIGPIFVQSGAVASQGQIDGALDSLFDTEYIHNVDTSLIG